MIENMNPIHYERFGALTNYVQNNCTGEGILLSRKEVLEVIGISEGDSAKRIFEIITQDPTFYSHIMSVEEEGRKRRFTYVGERTLLDTFRPISLNNVLKASEKKFVTYLSFADIIDMWQKQEIAYNPDIQRGLVSKTNEEGEEIFEAVYSQTNVNVISEKMISGNYHTDTIVLAFVREYSRGNFEFDNNTLSFSGGELYVLDGQHRLRGGRQAQDLVLSSSEDLSNLDYLVFPIQIEIFDTLEEAQDAFSQFAKGLKISSSREEFFNNTNIENRLLKQLVADSVLTGKVETVKNNILSKDQENLVTFATLINGLRRNFGEITEDNFEQHLSYLKRFFEILFEKVPEFNNYEERNISKRTSLKCENFAFYGYMKIAATLFESELSEEELRTELDKVSRINFDKNSDVWLGRITRQSSRSYSIVNNNSTRTLFENQIQEMFN